MATEKEINAFLSGYPENISDNAQKLRQVLKKKLPDIIEQIDLPARMIAYSYGPSYAALICVIIPSQKGLKLGFNRGSELPDPAKLLKGTGKVSRYVEITSTDQLSTPALDELFRQALAAYEERMNKKK